MPQEAQNTGSDYPLMALSACRTSQSPLVTVFRYYLSVPLAGAHHNILSRDSYFVLHPRDAGTLSLISLMAGGPRRPLNTVPKRLGFSVFSGSTFPSFVNPTFTVMPVQTHLSFRMSRSKTGKARKEISTSFFRRWLANSKLNQNQNENFSGLQSRNSSSSK